MKAVVIYKSQTGFTKCYAQWIAEELGCDAVSFAERDRVNFENYDTVLWGGWFHAASVTGSSWYKKQMERFPDKRYAVFAVGATPPLEDYVTPDELREIFEHNFPSATFPSLRWFYFHGGYNPAGLGLVDKLLMKMFLKAQEKKAETDPFAAGALEQMKEGFDATDRAAIVPLVAWVREADKTEAVL